MKRFLKETEEITIIDIGCSGSLPIKWKPLWEHINLIGFDPNIQECQRLAENCKRYLSAKILPYAISDKNGDGKRFSYFPIFDKAFYSTNSYPIFRFH